MEKRTIKLPSNLHLDQETIDCYIYDNLTSTNSQTWELSEQSIRPPFVVVAKQQTAGRGQRGNRWESLEGGLYLTLMLSMDKPMVNFNHLTLFCAVGIVSELHKYQIPVRLKWLNDLILNEQKLGGILCETRSQNNLLTEGIVGVGINWQNVVSSDRVNDYICLRDYVNNQQNSLVNCYDDLLSLTVTGILNGYYIYKNETIESIVNLYNQYLIYRGKQVYLENTLGEIVGINNNGDLIVKFSALGASSKAYFSPQNYAITPYKSGRITQMIER